ncbi:MAG: tetratricopeptide repeat protein [Candidatus Binatia bacterium]|nr:tetratricopeptide repeat protein [Candidatus Binatia bacterium]
MREQVESAPDDPWAHYNLGVAYDQVGQTEEALAAFGQALALNPEMMEARFNQGVGLLELGRNEDARGNLEAVTQIAPDFPPGWFMLGVVCGVLEDLPAAVAATRQGLALDPKSPPGWSNLARMLAQQGDLSAGMDAFKQAIEVQPDFIGAYLGLGTVFAWSREPELREQIPMLHDPFRMNLQDAEDGLRFTLALLCLGQTEDMRASMAPLREARPEYAAIVERLAKGA